MPPQPFHSAADFASKCSGKIRYSRHAHAQRVVDIMIRDGKGTAENFRVYSCKWCGGYHTGHRNHAQMLNDRRRQEQQERDRAAFAWLAPAGDGAAASSASPAQDSASPTSQFHVHLSKKEREQEEREERRRRDRMRRKQERNRMTDGGDDDGD